jgi:DNA modification methylase
MNYLNEVFTGDCRKIFKKLPPAIVDLVVTSVPYNTNHPYDVYKDDKKHETYIKMLESVFGGLYPILKKGGRVAINVGDQFNGKVHTHADIAELMVHKLGYMQMTTLIWEKQNTSNRTAWGSFQSPKNPSFPTPFEFIMVFAKESYSLQEDGKTDLTKEEFVDWSMAMWKFPRQAYKESTYLINKGVHPAPFPEELPKRLIKMLSWVGATVMDPMSGSGSTLIAAKRLGRNYIGCELSKSYAEYSKTKLKYVMIPYTIFE